MASCPHVLPEGKMCDTSGLSTELLSSSTPNASMMGLIRKVRYSYRKAQFYKGVC